MLTHRLSLFEQVHEQADATRFCALSRVYRWTFVLSDHFCEPLGVRLVRGDHLPRNADLSTSASTLKSKSESESKSASKSKLQSTVRKSIKRKGTIHLFSFTKL